jgi:hypothetical protein
LIGRSGDGVFWGPFQAEVKRSSKAGPRTVKKLGASLTGGVFMAIPDEKKPSGYACWRT